MVKPIGTILQAENTMSANPFIVYLAVDAPSTRIFSALASLMPLTVHSCFLGVKATASTVW